MKNLFKKYKEWRDKRFVDRINSVYFKKANNTLVLDGSIIILGDVRATGVICSHTKKKINNG